MTISNEGFGANGATERIVPIACSLSAAEAVHRVERWNEIVKRFKLGARSNVAFVEAEFRNEAGVREEIELLVTAERECCPFLLFDLRQTETALILTVSPSNADADAAENLALLAPALGIV